MFLQSSRSLSNLSTCDVWLASGRVCPITQYGVTDAQISMARNDIATGRNDIATGRNDIATGRNDIATGRNDIATGRNE